MSRERDGTAAGGLLLLTLLVVLAAPLAIEAQQPQRVPRIGILSLASGPVPNTEEPFLQGLRDLGYIEGQNLLIDKRYAGGSQERLDQLATELVELKVDVIVAGPAQVTRAAQRATRTIPIVMPVSGDPVGFGLVASLARPGGNVTGLSGLTDQLSTKRVEMLKEAVPGARRIALLVEADSPLNTIVVPRISGAVRSLGMQPMSVEWQGPDDLERAFAAAIKGEVGALLILDSVRVFTHRKRIVELALARRLPTMFYFREYVDEGGFMAYGPNLPDLYRRAATYVHRILRGAKPADLPVEQPTKFDLAINRRTAKALGLTIPRSILSKATVVID